jgi:hypothetical protein
VVDSTNEKSMTHKIEIDSRLNAAVKDKIPTNRSADLVPLKHDFEMMRKKLRSLVNAAEHFKSTITALDKARLNVTVQVHDLARDTPVQEIADSELHVNQKLSDHTQVFLRTYQDKIINYATEWEYAVSTRVDRDQKSVDHLQDRLAHYQTKVGKLREKVNTKEAAQKRVAKRLSDKLARNEKKLAKAWQIHETTASKLCDLLEEIVKAGWKDLYPLLRSTLEVEKVYNKEEESLYAELEPLMSKLDGVYKEKRHEQVSAPRVAADPTTLNFADTTDVDSVSSGSYHSEEEDTPTTPVTVQHTTVKVGHNAQSPTGATSQI